MIKKSALTVICFVFLFSAISFCAKTGDWGLSANNLIGNIINQEMDAKMISQSSYTSLFYYFTDDLSVDVSFAILERQLNVGDANISATYVKALYDLGKGNIIPHVGLEYMTARRKINEDADYYSSFNMIFGLEVKIVNGLSLLVDLKVLAKTDTEDYENQTEHESFVSASPFLSIRWYL